MIHTTLALLYTTPRASAPHARRLANSEATRQLTPSLMLPLSPRRLPRYCSIGQGHTKIERRALSGKPRFVVSFRLRGCSRVCNIFNIFAIWVLVLYVTRISCRISSSGGYRRWVRGLGESPTCRITPAFLTVAARARNRIVTHATTQLAHLLHGAAPGNRMRSDEEDGVKKVVSGDKMCPRPRTLR